MVLIRVILKDGLYIEMDNREKLVKKLYVDLNVKLVMDDMYKFVFEN